MLGWIYSSVIEMRLELAKLLENELLNMQGL